MCDINLIPLSLSLPLLGFNRCFLSKSQNVFLLASRRFNYHPQNDLFLISQPTSRLLWMPKRKKNCRRRWSGGLFDCAALSHPLRQILAQSDSKYIFFCRRMKITRFEKARIRGEEPGKCKTTFSVQSTLTSALNLFVRFAVPQVVLIFKMFHLCSLLAVVIISNILESFHFSRFIEVR